MYQKKLKRPSLLSKMATKLELFSVIKLIKIRMKQSIFLVKKNRLHFGNGGTMNILSYQNATLNISKIKYDDI